MRARGLELSGTAGTMPPRRRGNGGTRTHSLRHLPAAAIACFLVGAVSAGATRAQDAGPPPPHVQFAPPGAAAPADDAPPLRTPPALATPEELVGKSIDDLSKGRFGAAAHDDIKALRRGPLLIHGNYCGIGNRPGAPPVDDLDAACMRHDACTQTGKMPSCKCDDLLRIEAGEIAQDPATRADIAALATATAASMTVLICK